MSARIKIIALVYVFVLAGIVVLADISRTQHLFTFVRSLPFGDKIGHFCLMGTFSFVINLALNARTFQIWKLNYLIGSAIVLTIVYVEEFSQMFVRGRTFDAADLLADALGIFVFGEAARFFVNGKISFSRR